jgi:hypothetical protein
LNVLFPVFFFIHILKAGVKVFFMKSGMRDIIEIAC